MHGLLHTTVGIDLDLAVVGPAKTDGQSELQLPAACFLSNGFQRTLPQQVPLLLELRDYPEFPLPQSLDVVKQVFEELESLEKVEKL